jgi:hypothetical protein
MLLKPPQPPPLPPVPAESSAAIATAAPGHVEGNSGGAEPGTAGGGREEAAVRNGSVGADASSTSAAASAEASGVERSTTKPEAPRLSRVLRAVARLGRRFGLLRFTHAGRIKAAVIAAARSVLLHQQGSSSVPDLKITARVWQAFGYACAALLCPRLLQEEPVTTLARAVAEPLPTPGGGPIAAASGAIGIGLLEMAASITAANPRTAPAVATRLNAACAQLAELRGAMLQLSQDDIHRYCALLSAVYERPGEAKQAKLRSWTLKCGKQPSFLRHVMLKLIVLPRQVRGKYRKKLRKERRFLTAETPMLVVKHAVTTLQMALLPPAELVADAAETDAADGLASLLAQSVEGDWLVRQLSLSLGRKKRLVLFT